MLITLFRDKDCWAARFSGPGSERILTEFGTDTLPCAFTAEAPAEIVLQEIQKLNPTAEVRIGEKTAYCTCTKPAHPEGHCRNLPSPLNRTGKCQGCFLDICDTIPANNSLLN